MPRFPGSVSGASKVRVAFPLVDPLPSTDSAAAFGPALFARFSGTMGPSDSLETCMSVVRHDAFSDRPPPSSGAGVSRVSRFPCKEFPRMRRVFDSAASMGGLRWSSLMMLPSPCQNKVGTPNELISELNGWPACAPVNASPAMLPPPAHDSGLERFATPFLCGSFIRYSLPALTGAFSDPGSADFSGPAARGLSGQGSAAGRGEQQAGVSSRQGSAAGRGQQQAGVRPKPYTLS